MKLTGFSKWKSLDKLGQLDGPGVYAIAKSTKNLSNKRFRLIKEIEYFGKAERQTLHQRLKQFNTSLKTGKRRHSGGRKFYNCYHGKAKEGLYVALHKEECNPKSDSYRDLLLKGEIAKLELVCAAEYVKKYGRVPKFWDKSSK